jgi:deoxycytidylate deaminase
MPSEVTNIRSIEEDGANKQAALANNIDDRLSQELIIALVGPVGSGVSTAASMIRNLLVSVYKYEVPEIIKMSDFIKNEAYRVDKCISDNLRLDEYIDVMQTTGNKLREKFGSNYIAEKTIEKIVAIKERNNYYKMVNGSRVATPKRIAFIVDSIKNIDEYNLLRQIYRDTLVVFGVFAPDEVRKGRLIDNSADKSSVDAVIDRDQSDVPTFGQMTRKTFIESDFFICNDANENEMLHRIERYFDIIFNTKVRTPTRHESAMYKAESAAANSACMSRQVGASILSSTGELIAVGWNDVPKFGGGLYNEDDQHKWSESKGKVADKDNRCFKYNGGICHNETRRGGIISKISTKIINSGMLKRGNNAEEIKKIIGKTEIDSIIEYSRSIHAEMEAILSVAREGKGSIVGSTLYTTTYPCHNCARHIVAAGIREVIYIQPYLKSLAISLHGDAISEKHDDKERVVFRQYDGVAPRNFLKLFKPIGERKKDGRLDRVAPDKALPILQMPLDGFHKYEDKVLADLDAKEQTSA